MSLIKKASRKEAHLKLNFAGPSGSGKTMSALKFAKGFLGSLDKVCVLDTENGSANLYEHIGGYSVLPMEPPFHPKRFVSAIKMIQEEGFEFLIIDSATHEWDGPGGVLEIHSNMAGNSFTNWKKVTPIHDSFISEMLQCKMHVIATTRKKQKHSIDNSGGKARIEKTGLDDIQRDGFEYDFTIAFSIEMNHMATTSKNRTNLFDDDAPFFIDESIGKQVREWNQGSKKK